jgi:hypothetical protein
MSNLIKHGLSEPRLVVVSVRVHIQTISNVSRDFLGSIRAFLGVGTSGKGEDTRKGG